MHASGNAARRPAKRLPFGLGTIRPLNENTPSLSLEISGNTKTTDYPFFLPRNVKGLMDFLPPGHATALGLSVIPKNAIP